MYNANIEQYMNDVMDYRKRLKTLIPVLSIFVILIVFWCLKLTGITMAGEAFCGYDEHQHNEECTVQALICEDAEHEHADECYEITYSCDMTEHIHTADCYSDISADLETAEIWEETIKGIPPELSQEETLIAVAETQLDYQESDLNFTVDEEKIKHGYTRYGEWYGNPYGEWSTMFTSFCLHYAGVEDMPSSAGAESMQMELQEAELYRPSEEFTPYAGNIVFLDKDSDGTADVTAIVTEVSGASITVIEGDLDNKVAENSYELADKSIIGYGLLPVVMTETMELPEKTIETKTFAGTKAPERTLIATTSNYDEGQLHVGNRFILYTQGNNGNYYAIDGNGNAVQIYVDSNGKITTNSTNIDSLYWTFEYYGTYDRQRAYYIQNAVTGQYLHPHVENNVYKSVLSGRYETALYSSDNGARLRGARQEAYAQIQNNNSVFAGIRDRNSGSVMYIGKEATKGIIWLDGTNGGLRGFAGSPDRSYTAAIGSTFTLPTEWQSPTKYGYKLNGWYDVTNSEYYKPGDTVKVTGDMVFYADWVAETYDIGEYNQYVADTVSTNSFVTTHVFDYNYLFNALSATATVNVTENGHTETWVFVPDGTVPYQDGNSLGFVFADYHSDINIANADQRNAANRYDENVPVVTGIYNERLREVLFSTETDVIGKTYLGQGDHMFIINEDPSSPYYGYYYYDCSLNAVSYNQSDQRFYVYDYLERTADSASAETGKYADILPLNSPYQNNNGQNPLLYDYNGVDGEYAGVKHNQYDINNDITTGTTAANMAFGMSIDIEFYLPNAPGARDETGDYGNEDIYGKDMHFQFAGDDDLWVLIDGEVILDVGGVHTEQVGDINFSSGVVTVNGQTQRMITDIAPGEHTLTILYLERGGSMSNGKFLFNLAPRFSLELQKEDVLTQELLDGAEFSVYLDEECTQPAELWTSQEAHDSDEPSTNKFTVQNGIADMWGFGAGNTYYLKETRAPDAAGYDRARGIIRLTFDKTGLSSHSIEVMAEVSEDGEPVDPSNGYTVHGFRIDETKQMAYITVTNAQDWVEETTTVQVMKHWNDKEDHTYDSIQAYLTITDPDGTVRRIREITLSEENDWKYIWTGLPKYYQDGVTEVQYGVEEAYKEGYSPSIDKIDKITVIDYAWSDVTNLQNGKKYYLKTPQGFLSTESSSSNRLCWKTEAEVIESPLAEWTATYYNNEVMLQNGAGQIINFNYSEQGSYFSAEKMNNNYRLGITKSGNDFQFYYRYGIEQYMGVKIENGKLYEHQFSEGTQTFDVKTLIKEEVVKDLEDDYAYDITNTPLDEETAVKVTKDWDLGMATHADYEKAQVTIRLMADGKDTGRTVTLSLKNNWTDTFKGLPYRDADGKVIEYTVEESWETEDWKPVYGEVITVGGGYNRIPTYETTVTNSYNWGHGYILPDTGGPGTIFLLLCGLVTMMGALACIYLLRHRREGGYG